MNAATMKQGNRFDALRLLGGVTILAISVYFVAKSLRLFSFDPVKLGKYFAYRWVIMGHVAGGAFALFTGPFQLWSTFRQKYLRAHRIMGRVYIGGVVAGAICALVLATTTAPVLGWAYALSLHMLASVWLGSALLAWRTAVARRIAEHETWATRSYIATIAFVAQSLSFEIPFVVRLGSFADVAPTIIWFSWTVPMVAYDIVRTVRARALVRR